MAASAFSALSSAYATKEERVRLRERFVNPQLLKQLAVYKIKERLK
ncbi:MAG: hypothetical protein MR852_07425 [Treponema sp.]|nr:hypothetical protein [Treponema sp.]MCI7567444.1 hypothetical protein [Treponema sp.]